jgi:predicted amidophosphoribosyltransferase
MPDGVRTEALDGVASLGWYRDPVLRGAIWQAKYIGDERVWDVIERWIRGSAVEARLPLRPWVVAHVPLHAARCRERGYDQAKRIADILARHLGLPEEDMLTRKSWTDPQARTGSHDRALGDLEGAFRAVGQPPQFVLLCDDVFTSGATMDAAARTLKDAGAEVVWGFVLGRG